MTDTHCPRCGQPTPAPEVLPQARNTRMIFVGRNVFSIDGVPGLYCQKKPSTGEPGDPVKARKCVGKGNAWGYFYRLPELEERLLAALHEGEKT